MMEELLEKIQKMLEGEKKRREIAIIFLEELTSLITEPCQEIYENIVSGYFIKTVWIKSGLYFRFRPFKSEYGIESEGFYYSYDGSPTWGKPLNEVRGKGFWTAISNIINWLAILSEDIEAHKKSREELTEKLKRF